MLVPLHNPFHLRSSSSPPEDRHRRVADELLDRAAVLLQDRAQLSVVAAHHLAKSRMGTRGLLSVFKTQNGVPGGALLQPRRSIRLNPLLSASTTAAAAGRSLARWSGFERKANLPFMTEWIDDPAEQPAVLVVDWRGLGCAGGHRLPDNALGIFDDEQRPAGRAIDCARAEALHLR